MKFLELKVIPPLQVLFFGLLMLISHRYLTIFHFHTGYELELSRGILILSLAVFIAAVYPFWHARTTVNPIKIDNTSSLITNGVFTFSRNPIYVVDTLLLLSWVIWLGQWLNLLFLPVFIWYITQFQIKPEENTLRSKFGSEYETYCKSTRRWI